ncbi:M48 family metallopeptidase [Streptomyces olivochromogenes]|uniref:M48 family metallopeptidase n=1 Tax=Streptomyces olivochromogenes TaxID=1963 RepID=UPI001F174B05|nr:M48 family metallopeptidase [Streptomyces olivochromogenes]MCF3134117.1 M48 family metallopeptidase [Streptomyces olivochromogenes]
MGEPTQNCPQCGAPQPVDEGYPAWCAACDWNVAPELFVYGVGGTATLRRELAGRGAAAVFEELARDGTAGRRPRLTAAHVASYALALLVHGSSLVLLALGAWLIARGWPNPLAVVAGAVPVLLFSVLRPRIPRLTTALPRLHRADAPRLFRLVDAVAGELGTRGVDVVVVDPWCNAAVTSYGVRRRVLRLGLGLWYVLTPQQRVALLGHELGHFANGDTRHGLTVGTALHTLQVWEYLLRPERARHRPVRALLTVPHHAARSALRLLDRLAVHGFPRREYLADDLAARVASTEAALGLTETLLHAGRVEDELRRLAREGGAPHDERLWSLLADKVAAVPARERERLRRVSELTWTQVDDTHPPTHLRLALLDRRGPGAPGVVCDAPTARAVERELWPAARSLARAVARGA